MTTACYKSGDDDKSDNKDDKIYLLLKDDVGGSHVRSRARSDDLGSYDHSVTIAFLFGVISDKQLIVKKLFSTR